MWDRATSLVVDAVGEVRHEPPDRWLTKLIESRLGRDPLYVTGRTPQPRPVPRCGRRSCGEPAVVKIVKSNGNGQAVWRCSVCAAKDGIEAMA